MKVLVTGSAGKIGTVVEDDLRLQGYEVVSFDLAHGQDILNLAQVEEATDGCDSVVHLAAHLGDEADNTEVINVNVAGMWNVLQAAARHSVKRVVFASSVEVLGVFRGERAPDYLPLDDESPCYPASAYAMSKRLGEEMCCAWTRTTGISSLCLRLPGVFAKEDYEYIIRSRNETLEFEWSPFWQYGAFLDVRDAASAIQNGLTCSFSGHENLLLCAEDISSASLSSIELVEKLLSNVEWRGGSEYEARPFKSLVDCRRAHRILGWHPQHRWRE